MTPEEHKALQQAIARLPRTAQPQRDLWPGIEHAINEPPQRAPWAQYAALAAALLLILFSSLQYGGVQPASTTAGVDRELLAALQSTHIGNKQALLVRYEDATPLYPAWRRQMEQLEQAEQVIYNALREEPANLELLKMLRQIQKRQLDLIDSVFAPRASAI